MCDCTADCSKWHSAQCSYHSGYWSEGYTMHFVLWSVDYALNSVNFALCILHSNSE